MTHRLEKKIFKIPSIPQLTNICYMQGILKPQVMCVLPSLKQTASLHLRMDGLNTISFSCWGLAYLQEFCRDQLAVSFRGGCILKAAASPLHTEGMDPPVVRNPCPPKKEKVVFEMTWHGIPWNECKKTDRSPVSLSLGGSPEVAPPSQFSTFQNRMCAHLQGPDSNRCFFLHSSHLWLPPRKNNPHSGFTGQDCFFSKKSSWTEISGGWLQIMYMKHVFSPIIPWKKGCLGYQGKLLCIGCDSRHSFFL